MLIGVVLWLMGEGIFIACSGVLDEAFCQDVILFYKAMFRRSRNPPFARDGHFSPRSKTEGLRAHASRGNFIAWFADVAEGTDNERGARPYLQAVILNGA